MSPLYYFLLVSCPL